MNCVYVFMRTFEGIHFDNWPVDSDPSHMIYGVASARFTTDFEQKHPAIRSSILRYC